MPLPHHPPLRRFARGPFVAVLLAWAAVAGCLRFDRDRQATHAVVVRAVDDAFTDSTAISSAVVLYRLQTGRVPETLAELREVLDIVQSSPYAQLTERVGAALLAERLAHLRDLRLVESAPDHVIVEFESADRGDPDLAAPPRARVRVNFNEPTP